MLSLDAQNLLNPNYKTKMSKENTLKPKKSIVYVTSKCIRCLQPSEVTGKVVGEKGLGLSCLPKQWTLPFIVISSQLFKQYNTEGQDQKTLIAQWSSIIKEALSKIKIHDGNIIIRSSGCSEGLEQRGKLHSQSGDFNKLSYMLDEYLLKLASYVDINQEIIPLIIQRHIKDLPVKGHLSNERRFYEYKRDWLGQFETHNYNTEKTFTINIRRWRKTLELNDYLESPLLCDSDKNIKSVLEIPAAWATYKKLIIHYEWVWDGKRIYVVQADQGKNITGVDPRKVYTKHDIQNTFEPKCLEEISVELAEKYHKISNVLTYKKLNLPTARLYILKDQAIIKELSEKNVPESLKDDIKELVKGSLVIRMDIATKDHKERQLLPRTQEERNLESAVSWLIESSAKVICNTSNEIAFIFHNFIPALASAFAYAAPNERNVQIEALWGLPEGIYYNAHDIYSVDTKTLFVDNLDASKFDIIKKRNYKHYFISPEEDGTWVPKILKVPYDWKDSIEKDEWINKIALESRRIADKENKSLSIMWFVDVPKEVCSINIFPWHHEIFDPKVTSRSKFKRTKALDHKKFTVKTNEDIEILRKESMKPKSNIKRVHIQPTEDSLLRNKKLLEEVGELTKEMDAVIFLEGGVLSHAFYQLMQTGAIVEVCNPFEKFSYKQDFNKLVRDSIPDIIEQGGESVNIGLLSGGELMKALKDKLIEEAFEVLDAADQESLIGELADVSEVIDGILHHLNITRDDLEEKKKSKQNRVGGFKDGIVLLGTDNAPGVVKSDTPLLDISEDKQRICDINYSVVAPNIVEKSIDRRENPSVIENLLRLDIPMILGDDFIITSQLEKNSDLYNKVELRVSGKRTNAKFRVEVSVLNKKQEYVQLSLKGLDES